MTTARVEVLDDGELLSLWQAGSGGGRGGRREHNQGGLVVHWLRAADGAKAGGRGGRGCTARQPPPLSPCLRAVGGTKIIVVAS